MLFLTYHIPHNFIYSTSSLYTPILFFSVLFLPLSILQQKISVVSRGNYSLLSLYILLYFAICFMFLLLPYIGSELSSLQVGFVDMVLGLDHGAMP